MEGVKFKETPVFKTPEEEISFLREQLATKEGSYDKELENAQREKLARETLDEYKTDIKKGRPAEAVGFPTKKSEEVVLELSPEDHDSKMEELLGVLEEKGLKHTLSVVENMENPHILDDFHRFIIQYIASTGSLSDIKERNPMFNALRMTLYEVALPDAGDEDAKEKTFKEMVAAMEQFYAGMLSVADGKEPQLGKNYFTIEIANSSTKNEVVFYVSVPTDKKDLFEKQIHGIFSYASVKILKDDYNIFNEGGASVGAYARSSNNPIFSIKTYEDFEHDPLGVILNTFSKFKEQGEGAAIQIVLAPAGDYFIKRYGHALDQIRKGVKVKKAIDLPETFAGDFRKGLSEFIFSKSTSKKSEEGISRTQEINQIPIEEISKKIKSTILHTNIRVIASAGTQARAEEILKDIESAFNQFSNTLGNSISFKETKGKNLLVLFKEFSYRTWNYEEGFPLNLKELTTILHFPVKGISAPYLKQAKAGSAPAPLDIPKDGLLLGVNDYRGIETNIYMSPEDRLRHFYVVGQTGTGKTALLKNMIIQDIKNGEGVCMIDPHGSDIAEILGLIPKERIQDVIYFDPAATERPMGLNMLEYDERYPEQKTFVVDELLSIFNKLFDMQTAGGPAFEQYFRNSALLVMGHPESGNTLLEIGRVLADKEFRDMKLAHNTNPLLAQFWENAVKTSGEQALSNYVPYITNKFDVFLSNEIMRPVVVQEKSAFNFRKIMDEKKILLVNLSKGRLGEINANLIGLILVGKILMAALSRADAPNQSALPPFYLYIDEFQNITTSSIATILSEARKYGLSLNIAHQFIAQLDDKIRDAVFGNVGSIAAFRTGAEDAKFLESQFEPVFAMKDIMNLNNYSAYLKLLIKGQSEKPFSINTIAPEKGNPDIAQKLKELSYAKYGRPREEVEAEIMKKYGK